MGPGIRGRARHPSGICSPAAPGRVTASTLMSGAAMTAGPDQATAVAAVPPADDAPVPVYFVAESTGISAEAMGNALLVQFPGVQFARTRIPFITSIDDARKAVAILDRAM